jgi:hypothetical protein
MYNCDKEYLRVKKENAFNHKSRPTAVGKPLAGHKDHKDMKTVFLLCDGIAIWELPSPWCTWRLRGTNSLLAGSKLRLWRNEDRRSLGENKPWGKTSTTLNLIKNSGKQEKIKKSF